MPTSTQKTKQRIKRLLRSLLAWRVLWLPFVVVGRLGGLLRALHAGIGMNWSRRSTVFNFRRNVHRPEKGLSFPNRRGVFAEDYVGNTIGMLRDGRATEEFDEATVTWGLAVLTRYFEVVDDTPVVAAARRAFDELSGHHVDRSQVPYSADQRPAVQVTIDQLSALARTRRSVRFFTDESPDPDVVRQAIAVAAQAPSSCNRQAYRFLFFDEPETVDALAAVPGGIAGYRVPSIIVVVGRYRGYFDERDVKAPIVDASLAVMSFILALETLGLSSVCINWPNHPRREKAIRGIINLDDDEIVVMLVGLGYAKPEGLIPYSAKHTPEDLLLVNQRMKRP